MWTDSHCHLHDDDDLTGPLERASAAGVDRLVLIGTGVESSRRAAAAAAAITSDGASVRAYATVGLHPHDAKSGSEAIAGLLEEFRGAGRFGAAPGSLVAVGECGLDYFYEHSERELQRRAFAEQIELATALGLCLIVHTRQAWDDTFAVLAEAGVPARIVIHCFTGGPEEARRCLDLGAFLSFSGIVTFKNAGDIREAAVMRPADRLLVETDAPYLTPVPHRGRPNEPAFVALVGEAVAELRATPAVELAALSSANAAAAFGLSG